MFGMPEPELYDKPEQEDGIRPSGIEKVLPKMRQSNVT
jgi:hypothetical protein